MFNIINIASIANFLVCISYVLNVGIVAFKSLVLVYVTFVQVLQKPNQEYYFLQTLRGYHVRK
jgi:hypothetical protein